MRQFVLLAAVTAWCALAQAPPPAPSELPKLGTRLRMPADGRFESTAEAARPVRQLLEAWRFTEALEAASQLNQAQPDEVTSYELKAEAELALGRYADAEKSLQWATDLKLGKPTATTSRLIAEWRRVHGDFAGAIEMINGAFARNPRELDERVALLVDLADLQRLSGRTAEAARLASEVLKVRASAEAHAVLARMAKPEEAIAQWRRAVAASTDPRWQFELALALEKAGQPAAEAYAAFEKAARAMANQPRNANRELIFYYCSQGKQPGAALALAQAEFARRQDAGTRHALAWALYANGQRAAAQKQFQEIEALGVMTPEMKQQAEVVATSLRVTPERRAAKPRSTDERIAAAVAELKAGPATGTTRVELAAAYLQKLRETPDFSLLDRAAKLLDEVLADPSSEAYAEARVLQIEVALHRHEFARAAELAGALAQARPREARAWAMLGDAHLEMGNYGKAADAYDQMLGISHSLASLNRAAHYRFVTGDLDGAIVLMEKAARLGARQAPENTAWVLVELGNLYWRKPDAAQAEAAYQAALQLFPGYHAALAGWAKVRAGRGEKAEALALYQQAQKLVPLPEYVAGAADLLAQLGRTAEAEQQWQLLDQIHRLEQAQGEKTNRKLALIYADHRRHLDRALALAQAEMAVRQDVFSYDALAWALFQNGRVEEAAAAMEKALAQNTPEPMFQRHAEAIRAARAASVGR
jgi:tetratricopeptide (TPR) repeat protein